MSNERNGVGVSRNMVFVAACLGMLAFGIVLTTLGTILPSVMVRFGLDKTEAGALFPVLTGAILVGTLLCGPAVDRFGFKGMLALATLLIVVGLEGIAVAPSMVALRVAVAVIGLGGGVLNSGTNALVADISEDGRTAGLSLLGVFFGVGAAGMPFTLGVLQQQFGYVTIIEGVGAVGLAPLLYILLIRFPAPKHPHDFPLSDAARLVRDPILLLMGLMLFLGSGLEITVGGWTSTFFAEELGLVADRALIYLSLYWVGMMLARLALGSALRRAAPQRVMLGCVLIAIAGSIMLLASRTLAPSAVGVFLLGVGFAATFPVVLGFVGDRYPRLSGTAFSLVISMALIGGMFVPYMTGAIGNARGLRVSFLIVPTALVLLATLLVVVSTRLRAATAVA
jgi:MFS transporter, FHS family, glucose/mannose:H+ symporter